MVRSEGIYNACGHLKISLHHSLLNVLHFNRSVCITISFFYSLLQSLPDPFQPSQIDLFISSIHWAMPHSFPAKNGHRDFHLFSLIALGYSRVGNDKQLYVILSRSLTSILVLREGCARICLGNIVLFFSICFLWSDPVDTF